MAVDSPLPGPPQPVIALAESAAPGQQPLSSGAGVAASPKRVMLRVCGILGLALGLCLLGYLAIAVPRSWFPAAKEQSYGAAEVAVTRGTGRIVNGQLHLTAPDAMGLTLVSVVTSFRSTDYAAIDWHASDIPEAASVQLLWRTDYAPGKLNSARIEVESGRTMPIILANNPAWIGRITGIALAIHGSIAQPIRIEGVVAKPMGAVDLLRDRAHDWFQLEGWTGASINTIAGGADSQYLPLPVLVACAIALAALAAYAMERWRPGTVGMRFPIALGVMFLAGWLLLDTRWVANLIRQEGLTVRQYGGKDSRARHLAAEDAPLFAFIERARGVLPSSPARVIVAADADYFRGRAAYHLYPHSVYFNPRSNDLPAASELRAGDWLIVFQRRGIQYDPARQALRWEGNQTRSAELKYVEPGGAVFLIR